MKKNEVAHYPEITKHIETQLKSNFLAAGIKDIEIYWKSGELKTKMGEIISEHPEKCACLKSYSQNMYPLNLDIFGVITDGKRFEIIILEVKLRDTVGLSEWSQLLGYNVVSNAKYGLLINIDGGASSRLSAILSSDSDASEITRVKKNGEQITHLLGFMQWNTITQNFEYSAMGQLWSLSALSRELIKRFNV